MKRVKDLHFFNSIRQIREFDFGVFFYFDGLVISEIKKGTEFKWEHAKQAVEATEDYFGENAPVVYISNRVNTYSIVATDWFKFLNNRQQ